MCRNCLIDIGMLLLGIIVFVLVMNMSYEDEVSEQQYYCEMVEAGHWPDHRDFSCSD